MSERYYIEHDTIHDRVTGKHVELQEAADLLSAEPDALLRIAWGVVTSLGVMLKNAEHDRDTIAAQLASAQAALSEAERRVLPHEERPKLEGDIMDAARDEAERVAVYLEGVGPYTARLAADIRAGAHRGGK